MVIWYKFIFYLDLIGKLRNHNKYYLYLIFFQIYAHLYTNYIHDLFYTVSGCNASQPTGKPSNLSRAESSNPVSFGQEYHNRCFVPDNNQSHPYAHNKRSAATENSYQYPSPTNIRHGSPKKSPNIPPPPPPEFLSKNKHPPPPPARKRSDSAFNGTMYSY